MGLFWIVMRLPGGANADVGVRILRPVAVHIQTIRVEVANIHEIAIGRALSLPSSLCNHQRFANAFLLYFTWRQSKIIDTRTERKQVVSSLLFDRAFAENISDKTLGPLAKKENR